MGPVLVLTQRRVKNLQIPVKKPLLFLTSLCALLNAPGELRATEGSASPLLRATEGSASPPPNIVLILADDLGYGDCSVTNSESKIKTPHIDQLAKEGLSFSDAHSAASTCTPSRYGLLTGINPVRTGVLNTLLAEGRAIISKDEKTIAHLLKDQGYATHMIGKWHLGFDTGGKKKDFDFDQAFIGGPIDRGFDSYFGIHSSPGAFPLFYASPIPHSPWVPSEAFKGKSCHGDYGDFVMQLDDIVGQINQALKDTGLDQNTLLIFTSDNGPGPLATRLMAKKDHRCAGPLRGSKASIYEGGHRVPFIAKWPDKVSAGTQTNTVINFTDFFATLATLFKADLANTYPSAKDSHSFLPALLGAPDDHLRPAMINGSYSIRQGDWKISSKGNLKHADSSKVRASQFELHKLTDDLAEQHDLSEDQPEKANQLLDQLQTFIKQRSLK